MYQFKQRRLALEDDDVVGQIEEARAAAQIIDQPGENAAADGQMDIGRSFLNQATERQTRNNLRGRRNRDANQVRLISDDRFQKALAKQFDVGVLGFIPDDLHQVFGRIDGAVAELIIDDRQPGREIERGEDLQPFIDKKQTFFIGLEIVEALPSQGLLGRLDPVDEIGESV